MEIKRFFTEPQNIQGETVAIEGDEFFHITKVLRLKKGFKIVVSVGDGKDYFAVIQGIEEGRLTAKIESVTQNETELPYALTMLQAIPAKDKIEIIVQKAAEMGVRTFIPFFSEHVNEKEVNLIRLNKIAREAAKQCGASRVMEILPPVGFCDAVRIAGESSVAVMAYEYEKSTRLSSVTKNVPRGENFSVAFMIGAEGGFSQSESEYASAHGITPVTLGKRILRCETAGVAVAAILCERLAGD
ncbi:MAG: 16S rRNA (uracil(1498)-N(3))-methyltransferase [Clostridiales bacterium]|jgi:16S rRNA (uracil1498-N3)-methyltransferase|nr:16S rRNA (uracil(1498)-N(3))-methyltransferase [Clostridiales bacterium]